MLVDYWPSILALTLIQVVGAISPGPDFAVVMRNSLIYSRKTGGLTALGVALGSLVHLTYILLGLGILISQTAWLFHAFKYLGAGYLIYVGAKGMATRKSSLHYGGGKRQKDISALVAIWTGFLTNVLNIKALFYFLSLISAFITPQTPKPLIGIYGLIIFLSTLIWFGFVATCFSHKRLRLLFGSSHHWIERVTGGLLMLLGIRMLFIQVGSLG